jgi:hypothetical protein
MKLVLACGRTSVKHHADREPPLIEIFTMLESFSVKDSIGFAQSQSIDVKMVHIKICMSLQK